MVPDYGHLEEIELEEYDDGSQIYPPPGALKIQSEPKNVKYEDLEEIDLNEYEDQKSSFDSNEKEGDDDLSEEGLGETTVKRRIATQNRERLQKWQQE